MELALNGVLVSVQVPSNPVDLAVLAWVAAAHLGYALLGRRRPTP